MDKLLQFVVFYPFTAFYHAPAKGVSHNLPRNRRGIRQLPE